MAEGRATAANGGFSLPIGGKLAQTCSTRFADAANSDDPIADDRLSAEVKKVRPGIALAIAWVTLAVIGTDLFVVSPLLPLIAVEYGVPPQRAALSVTAFALAYMLSAPLLGHLADRHGRRRVLGCGLAGFVVANLLTASAPTLGTLIAARALAGITAAGVTPSLYALVGEHAPPGRRGTWLAIAVSGLLTSLSLGTPIGAVAGARFGWPLIFVAFGAISLALLCANVRVWPKSSAPGPQAVSSRPDAAVMFRRLGLTVLWSTALYAMYTYLGAGLTAAGFTPDRVAETIFVYGAGAVAGNLIGGRLADRFGAQSVVGLSLLGLALAFLGLHLALETERLIGPALCLASIAAQLFFPAQQAGLASDFPTCRAAMLAWNNAALFFGISLGSLIGGEAVALGGFTATVAVSVLAAFAGWLMHVIARAEAARSSPAAGTAGA